MFQAFFFSVFGALLILHVLEIFLGFNVEFNYSEEYSSLFGIRKEECGRWVIFHFFNINIEVEFFRAGIYKVKLTILGISLWLKIYRQKDQDAIIEQLKRKLQAFPKGEDVNTPPVAA